MHGLFLFAYAQKSTAGIEGGDASKSERFAKKANW